MCIVANDETSPTIVVSPPKPGLTQLGGLLLVAASLGVATASLAQTFDSQKVQSLVELSIGIALLKLGAVLVFLWGHTLVRATSLIAIASSCFSAALFYYFDARDYRSSLALIPVLLFSIWLFILSTRRFVHRQFILDERDLCVLSISWCTLVATRLTWVRVSRLFITKSKVERLSLLEVVAAECSVLYSTLDLLEAKTWSVGHLVVDQSTIQGSRLASCILKGSTFTKTKVSKCHFVDTDLRDSVFASCCLDESVFCRCDLRGVRFACGPSFDESAQMTRARSVVFDSCLLDEDARLPRGVSLIDGSH